MTREELLDLLNKSALAGVAQLRLCWISFDKSQRLLIGETKKNEAKIIAEQTDIFVTAVAKIWPDAKRRNYYL